MKASGPEFEQTILASDFTVAQYFKARDERDGEAIADAIHRRFRERYLEPVATSSNGFTVMAICCLMIEAIESFHQGRNTTERRSAEAFRSFFHRESRFAGFRGVEEAFYKNIRCGILHQAETTGGWRIVRHGPLFAAGPPPTINAGAFRARLAETLEEYCGRLRRLDWNDAGWRKARTKMDFICSNCQP